MDTDTVTDELKQTLPLSRHSQDPWSNDGIDIILCLNSLFLSQMLEYAQAMIRSSPAASPIYPGYRDGLCQTFVTDTRFI